MNMPVANLLSRDDQSLHPIQMAEQLSGIGKDLLRMWERRYGFPMPLRDARGDRVYTSEQIEKLRLLRQLQLPPLLRMRLLQQPALLAVPGRGRPLLLPLRRGLAAELSQQRHRKFRGGRQLCCSCAPAPRRLSSPYAGPTIQTHRPAAGCHAAGRNLQGVCHR